MGGPVNCQFRRFFIRAGTDPVYVSSHRLGLLASLVAMMQFVGQSLSAVFIPVFIHKYRLKHILIFYS